MLKPSFAKDLVNNQIESLEKRRLLSVPAHGLTGEYFNGNDFQTPVLTRVDSGIDFNLTQSPDAEVGSTYSVRWTGQIEPMTTNSYNFTIQTNGGVRLWVGRFLVIDGWTNGTRSTLQGSIHLNAGQTYNIRVDYAANTGASADIDLLWSGKRLAQQNVPTANLIPDDTVVLPSGTGLVGQYYEGEHFNTLVMTRIDPEIDYNFGSGVPDPAMTPGEPFSIRWRGEFVPQYSEDYILNAITDDGVRVWIDGQLIIDNWHEQAAHGAKATLALQAGQEYDIRVDYYEDQGVASAKLYWQSASQAHQIVSANDLTHGVTSLSVPGNLQAQTISTSEIDLSWDAVANAASYTVQTSPDGSTDWSTIDISSGNTTTYANTALDAGTTYYYRVIAVTGPIQSDPATVASAITIPDAPQNLAASVVSDTEINLTWNDVTGENGFDIEESPDGSIGWTDVTSVSAGTTSYDVPALTASTTYYFRVLATNAGGTSAASNVANATTTGPIPAYASETSIYGLDTSGFVDVINTSTGAATQIGTLDFVTDAAGRDPVTGNFYYIQAGSSTPEVAVWDPTNNTNTILNASVAVGGVALAAFNDQGVFYCVNGSGDIYTIDRTTGDPTLVGQITLSGSPLTAPGGDIAFAPDGTLFMATNGILYTVDLSNLHATEIGNPGVGNIQIAFGQNSVLYATTVSDLYSINTTTAAATEIGATGDFGDLASVPLNADLSINQSAQLATVDSATTCTYSMTVSNAGPDATNGPITLTQTLPTGTTFVTGSGTGWIFNLSGSTLTMTYSAAVASSASAPVVTVKVSVPNGTVSPLVNQLSVTSTIFDSDTSNDTSTLDTPLT